MLGVLPERAAVWYHPILATIHEADLDTVERLAPFLATVGYESLRFSELAENLNYTAERMLAVWPKRFPSLEFAKQYEHNPKALGNYIYADRNGNGPEASGDGFRYRGHGLIHITGKGNHAACGKFLNLDLVTNPDLLTEPIYAARSAGWFWTANNLNKLADVGDFVGITRKVNGGLNGLADRQALLQRATESLRAICPA